MKKEMTCIVCPIGCQMAIEGEEGNWVVTGNTCKRGEVYAINEMTNPTRIVPTTVAINGANLPRIPVKTDNPIPKGKIFDVMAEVNKVVVEAPVKTGDIIIENVLDTGCNIVATRTLKKI
jgi:CxxC motif-containing protein